MWKSLLAAVSSNMNRHLEPCTTLAALYRTDPNQHDYYYTTSKPRIFNVSVQVRTVIVVCALNTNLQVDNYSIFYTQESKLKCRCVGYTLKGISSLWEFHFFSHFCSNHTGKSQPLCNNRRSSFIRSHWAIQKLLYIHFWNFGATLKILIALRVVKPLGQGSLSVGVHWEDENKMKCHPASRSQLYTSSNEWAHLPCHPAVLACFEDISKSLT